MSEKSTQYVVESLGTLIFTIRGQRVILDADLAAIYGVQTKRLNEQVRRNPDRFPPDFLIQLTLEEAKEIQSLRSHFATLKRGQHVKYAPNAFTEHGAIMAANVLNSQEAIKMSVFVVRAFVRMREHLISRSEMEKRLLKIEKVLLAHDTHIRDLYEKIRPLLLPPRDPKKREIGFRVRDEGATYKRRVR